MQSITWSPKLSSVIRTWKKSEIHNAANVSSKKDFLHFFGLSQEEEFAVSSITTKKSQNTGTQGLWQ